MNATLGRGRGSAARGTVTTAIGLVLLGGSVAAAALPAEDTSGANTAFVYSINAQGSGVGLVYDRYAFLALTPILNMAFPRASVGVDDTPTASSFASPADPGLLGALGAIGPVVGVPPGVIPPYPLYANASYPNGQKAATVGAQYTPPGSAQEAAEGVSGKAVADLDRASSLARFGSATLSAPSGTTSSAIRIPAKGAAREALPLLFRDVRLLLKGAGLSVPAAESTSDLVHVAGGEATSSALRSGRKLTANSEGRALGVSLLGGLIKIDSVIGSAKMTSASPTARPIFATSSKVAGASVMGFPVTFDATGIHFSGTTVPVPVQDAINAAISSRGGKFTVGENAATKNRAGVAALSLRFHGVFQPEVPPLLRAEQDDADLLLGAGVVSYSSALIKLPVIKLPAIGIGGTGGTDGTGTATSPLAAGTSDATADLPTSTGEQPTPEVAEGAGGTSAAGVGQAPGSTGLALLSSDSLSKMGWLLPFQALLLFLLVLLGWARARGLLDNGVRAAVLRF